MAKLIVKGGNLAWEGTPGRGGHIMFILQWLEGLRRLGHEVLYYDKSYDQQNATRLFAQIMERYWNPSLSALVRPTGDASYGLNGKQVEHFGRDVEALISLGCAFEAEPESWLATVRPRILVEQDPGFSQAWASKGNPDDTFGRHDIYFTVGSRIGNSQCKVPTFNLDWRHTWNPVILDWWDPNYPTSRERFTTVAGWWGKYYQEFEGKMWGPKAEEMRKFITLPRRTREQFEIALEIAPDDEELITLRKYGWLIECPRIVTANPEAYRRYVNGSAGEFSCAKGLYVGTKCGWFSDRSSCYLASGRPVVVQDTGFVDILPTGNGLFSVAIVEEAADAIRTIRLDYKRHAIAARNIASEYFDSATVLKRILNYVGVS
jgi:hypothetical protein